MVRNGRGLRALYAATAVATGFPMSWMRQPGSMADSEKDPLLYALSPPDLGHGWDSVREDAHASSGVVPSYLVRHQPKTWCECSRHEKSTRFGQLPDSLGVAAQAPSCHGTARSKHAVHGCVEVDEAYVGGEEKGVHGRESETKAIVVIAVEVHSPKGFGRVRLRQVPDVSSRSLLGFVLDAVAPGTVVVTDGWKGYNGLSKHGYVHDRRVLADSGDPAHVVLPGPHRIASLLKRWLIGTHQGAVSKDHLDYYLDEYTFRFNRRSSRSRGLLFHRLVEQAVQIEPTTYKNILGGKVL